MEQEQSYSEIMKFVEDFEELPSVVRPRDTVLGLGLGKQVSLMVNYRSISKMGSVSTKGPIGGIP